MKYHLTLDGTKAVCGAVANRPDVFLYDKAGFASHYASEYKCKKCEKIFNEMKDDKSNKSEVTDIDLTDNNMKILMLVFPKEMRDNITLKAYKGEKNEKAFFEWLRQDKNLNKVLDNWFETLNAEDAEKVAGDNKAWKKMSIQQKLHAMSEDKPVTFVQPAFLTSEMDFDKPVNKMTYGERSDYIDVIYIPHIKKADMTWSYSEDGTSFDYKAPQNGKGGWWKPLMEFYEKKTDYTEKSLPKKTKYKTENFSDIVFKDGSTELEEVESGNTYNQSYLGLTNLNWRLFHNTEEDKYFLIFLPHISGDVRGNYAEGFIMEGDDKDELMMKFNEEIIFGRGTIYITFGDGSELVFDSEQDSDVWYFRHEVSAGTPEEELGDVAKKFLDDFKSYDKWEGDQFLEDTVDRFLVVKGQKKKASSKKEMGGNLFECGGAMMAKGGVALSNFDSYYANHGSIITGGSYFNVEHKSATKGVDSFGKGGKAGDIDYEKNILPILEESVKTAWKPIVKKYSLYEENESEIENKSGEGFIAFTDGGYMISAYKTLTDFDGTGLKMPTEKSQKQIDEWIQECYDDAKKKIGDDDSEEFNEEYSECLGGIAVDFHLRAVYYKPDNRENEFKDRHAVYVYGIINEDLKDRKDRIEEGFSFDSIDQLKKELPIAIKKVLNWFKAE